MDNRKEKLNAAVEAHRDEYVALLADLVRCPSTLGNEKPAQERLLKHVTSMGLDGELWDLDIAALEKDNRFVAVDRNYKDRPNLIATLPPEGNGGRCLVLNGHIDVVSPEPIDWWKNDPWGAEIKDGCMYGRGALDMKGGLVQALLAIRAIQEVEIPLQGPVIFESVIEEECTGNGMLASRLRTGPVDGAIITEPVGPTATIANTGTMWVGVTVKGKPAYVGRAGEYVNAVEKAVYLISQLGGISQEINDTLRHPAYDSEERPFTFSVGTIQGGDWPSNVPLVCRFVCRLSYPPAVPVPRIQKLVERHIHSGAEADPWLADHPPVVDYPGFQAEGWAIDTDVPLVRTLATCHQGTTGEELKPGVLFGTADARYFDGAQGEQAVYYGPFGSDIHAPNEYVNLGSIVAGAKVLANFILEWCK